MKNQRRMFLLAVMFLCSLGALSMTQGARMLGQAAGPRTMIIDNKEQGYFIGNFSVSNSPRGFRSGVAFFYPYSYGSANAFGASTFRFDNVPAGTWKAYATWPANIQNNTQVRIRVLPNGLGAGADVTVNQRLVPSSIQYEGVGWHFLGNVVTNGNGEQVAFDIFAGPNEATLADAVMLQEVPQPPVCGNGRKEGNEECDDGNDNPNDGCYYGCQLNRCGDNRITQQLGEQCDDGNQNNRDSCTNDCRSSRCGDAIVQNEEQCDDGNTVDGDACRNNCTRRTSAGTNPGNALDVNADGRVSVKDFTLVKNRLDREGSGTAPAGPPYFDTNNDGSISPIDTLLIVNWLNAHPTCGDGNVTSPEQCDDDNMVNTDTCTNACRNAVCGDSFVQGSEQCDDGNTNNADSCTNSCRLPPVVSCGNGILEGTEQCDDGNRVNNDACNNDCRLARCGDQIVQAGEQCDDGNTNNTDSCSNACRTVSTSVCGNGICEADERMKDIQCGSGICGNPKYCPADCAVCGNFILEGTEQCDDGNRVNNDTCNNNCRLARCGDQMIQGDEQCDDGNVSNGDGCTAACRKEPKPYCGDGMVNGEDQCDDGNGKPGDGCDQHCKKEFCGDNKINNRGLEECDAAAGTFFQGEWRPRVGCNACKIESCGDGTVQLHLDEQCDDRNRVAGDGCDQLCQKEQHGSAGDISIKTTVPTAINAGANVDYLFQVTNNGARRAENIIFRTHFFEGNNQYSRISFPFDLVAARFGNGEEIPCEPVDNETILCEIATIEPESTRNIILTYAVPANTFCGAMLQHQAAVALSRTTDNSATAVGKTSVRCMHASCNPPALTGSAWQNQRPLDVTNDGQITRDDAYHIVSELNANFDSYRDQLPLTKPSDRPFYDVDGNNYLTSRDALLIVNYLNQCNEHSV